MSVDSVTHVERERAKRVVYAVIYGAGKRDINYTIILMIMSQLHEMFSIYAYYCRKGETGRDFECRRNYCKRIKDQLSWWVLLMLMRVHKIMLSETFNFVEKFSNVQKLVTNTISEAREKGKINQSQ